MTHTKAPDSSGAFVVLTSRAVKIRVTIRDGVGELFLQRCRERGLTPTEVLRWLAADFAGSRLTLSPLFRPPKYLAPKEAPGGCPLV